MNLDGAPVDRGLLEGMTRAMESRAPDESNTWVSSNVGFGHAMLRISPESRSEHQPCTLDGKVWITADARIDGRRELIDKLNSAGEQVADGVPDVELILYAYAAFSERFLEHLLGDFAFALWDEREKKLICARDHFGVRPFFYARIGNALLFASNIDALLVNSAISRSLNERYVTDFLLIGSSMQPEDTVYSNIDRFLPAHYVRVQNNKFTVKSYWEIRYPDKQIYHDEIEFEERFSKVFERAVMDRARGARVSVELSGGMDSSAIAAALSKHYPDKKFLTASTITNKCLHYDESDKRYAELAANFLGIRQECFETTDYCLFERFETPDLRTAEPFGNPLLAMNYSKLRGAVSSGARLVLTGQGGDEIFAGNSDYFVNLLQRGHFLNFAWQLGRHFRHTGTLRGTGLRFALSRKISVQSWRPAYPHWIESAFAARNHARARWHKFWDTWNDSGSALSQLQRPWFGSSTFPGHEALDLPIVTAHPFLDLRLINLSMQMPNYKLHGKKVMRQAMRGMLPEVVLERNKSGGAYFDFIRERFLAGKIAAGLPVWDQHKSYVNARQYQEAHAAYLMEGGNLSTWTSWIQISPILFNCWLQTR